MNTLFSSSSDARAGGALLKYIYTLLESFTKQFITVAKILRGDTYTRFSNERLRYALAICSLAVSNIFSNSSIFSTAPGLGVNVFN